MIKLNKWESQYIWLAKNWFEEVPYNIIPEMTKIKIIWAERCGLKFEHVINQHIAEFLINLVVKVYPGLNAMISKFIMDLAPQYKYTVETLYTDNEGYIENIIKVILHKYLSIVEVKNVLDLEEKDYTMFDKYIERRNK